MLSVSLSSIGEEILLKTNDLAMIHISLSWLKKEDLDLMIFYKTSDGNVGYVNSPKLPKGKSGNIKEYPFMKFMGSGTKEYSDGSKKLFNKVDISSISNISELFFVVTNISDYVLRRPINFYNYSCVQSLKLKYGEKITEKLSIRVSSEESGDFLILSKIFKDGENFILKNLNQVTSAEEFLNSVPGAYLFKR